MDFYYIKLVLNIISVIFFYSIVYPQFLFRYKVKHNNITVYTNQISNRNDLINIIEKADINLKKSELYVKKNHQIFLWNNKILFKLQTLRGGEVIAKNNPILNKIHTAQADIDTDKVLSYDKKTYSKLSSVLTHEMTHTLLRKKLGFFKFLKLPKWKNEGYCDYIAKNGSFDFDKGLKLLCNDREDKSGSFEYFKYRLYITYLIDIKSMTIEKINSENIDVKKLHNEVVKYYKAN